MDPRKALGFRELEVPQESVPDGVVFFGEPEFPRVFAQRFQEALDADPVAKAAFTRFLQAIRRPPPAGDLFLNRRSSA